MKTVTMYTSTYCRDCKAARDFLSRNDVSFQEVNIDQKPEAAKFVMQINHGKRSVPTFDVEGTYVNCSPFTPEKRKELAKAIGLQI
jgi:mycoredoxin